MLLYKYLHSRPGAPQQQDLLIILLDIDYFKKINDEFGHAGGDAVLVQFALRLQQSGAPVFRMGGEEFMILEFAGSLPDQQALLDKTLKLISAQEFDLGIQKLRVTTSIGAACFSYQAHRARQPDAPEPSNSLEQVIRIADAALYQAKQAGRNRAVLAEVKNETIAEFGLQIGDGRGKFRE